MANLLQSCSMKYCHAFFLVFALAGFSSSATAEWVEIERFEDGMRVYVDAASARREGDLAEVRHLVNWAEAQEEPGQAAYRSTIVRTRYDCLGKGEKYLSSVSHAEPMGKGVKVAADGREAESWYSISSGSMEEKLWEIACKGGAVRK